ncbi:MAG: hypothetical protein ABL958_06870 [Bdellovibrionia bacterium]
MTTFKITLMTLTLSILTGAPAFSNTVPYEKVEDAIIDTTDTSDLYVSKLDRDENVICSAEVEVDNKIFFFRVDSGIDDSEVEVEFDKKTGLMRGLGLVTFTKLRTRGNGFDLQFTVRTLDGRSTENGILNVRTRKDGRWTTGARVTLEIGGRKLSCDGPAS